MEIKIIIANQINVNLICEQPWKKTKSVILISLDKSQ